MHVSERKKYLLMNVWCEEKKKIRSCELFFTENAKILERSLKSLETEFFGMKNITKVMPIFSVLSYYSYYEKSIIDLKYPPEFVIFVIDTKKRKLKSKLPKNIL